VSRLCPAKILAGDHRRNNSPQRGFDATLSMTELIASSQTLTLRSSARFTSQDAELLTQHLSDNEQRFDQNGQVGRVLDQLLDAGLELYRSQEDWIDENNPVRVIDVFVDELDLGAQVLKSALVPRAFLHNQDPKRTLTRMHPVPASVRKAWWRSLLSW
jgi:hypothetical protein